MPTFDLISVILQLLLVAASASGVGYRLIVFLNDKNGKKSEYGIEFVGFSLLIGIGVLAFITLVLGLFGYFTKEVISLMLILMFLVNIQYFKKLTLISKKSLKNIFSSSFENPITLIFISISLFILATLFLASLLPPHAPDTLAYHFPQARNIAVTGRVDLAFGGHYFYGNIPKLAEVIFAMGIALGSYSLATSLGFLLLLAFLLVVYGVIYKYFDLLTASLCLLLLLLFHEFTRNAIIGYVDSITIFFEFSALLLFGFWLKTKDNHLIYASSVLIGLALSVKYSAIPTMLFMVVVFLFTQTGSLINHKSTSVKSIIIIFLFGSFWYIKNLILFKNPTYPLFFGHPGVENSTYQSLVEAIRQFKPKTLNNFLEIISFYPKNYMYTAYAALFLGPLTLFVKKNRKFNLYLLSFTIFYTFYWFFFATHQVRFLASAIVTSLILLSILVANTKIKFAFPVIIYLSFAFIAFNLVFYKTKYYWPWKEYWDIKTNLKDRQYALGNETKDTFLSRKLGCNYDIIRYINQNELEGSVIDNWTAWHGLYASYYALNNKFDPISGNFENIDEHVADIKEKNYKYILIDESIKESHLNNNNSIIVESVKVKKPIEEHLLNNAELIFQIDDCKLYEIGY